MKAVILAGGLGTRISEETHLKPKPMIEIGGKPILWHIMKQYSQHGINDFIICCGYKGYLIKEYFFNYSLHLTDITINTKNNQKWFHNNYAEDWNVTLVDTGENTLTGGRLTRISRYLENDEHFCFTYGDGVGDIDISKAIKEHKKKGKLATVTATKPPSRFGSLSIVKNSTFDQSNSPFNLSTKSFRSFSFKIVGDPPPKKTVPTFSSILFSFKKLNKRSISL